MSLSATAADSATFVSAVMHNAEFLQKTDFVAKRLEYDDGTSEDGANAVADPAVRRMAMESFMFVCYFQCR